VGLHLANREINVKNQEQVHFLNVKKLCSDFIVMVVIATFIAFLKPFGMQNIPFYYAWLFWVAACFAGYFLYSPIIYFGQRFTEKYFKLAARHQWVGVAVSSIIASLLFSFIIPLINLAFFNIQTDYLILVPQMIPYCLVIGGFITFVGYIKTRFSEQKQALQAQSIELDEVHGKVLQAKDEKIQGLMAKLPLEKRGKLLCLEMDDHYLNVHTEKGNHLVLMRFKDALSLVEDYPGIRTHRSWWVALDAIVGEERDGRKNLLKLSNEILVPVSKTYLASVKQSLLTKSTQIE